MSDNQWEDDEEEEEEEGQTISYEEASRTMTDEKTRQELEKMGDDIVPGVSSSSSSSSMCVWREICV
jgi:hypothetical protein